MSNYVCIMHGNVPSDIVRKPRSEDVHIFLERRGAHVAVQQCGLEPNRISVCLQ